MSTDKKATTPKPASAPVTEKLLEQYGCGPVQFAGTANGLYERHLIFDSVVGLTAAGARERFEAAAHSVRDVLSQRWIRTEETYAKANAKRVYYLSMEFLIGRSLANNVTNLRLDPIARSLATREHLDWLGLLEQEPDAGLGNGGLGRLAACFLDSMATLQLPGHGLRAALRVRHLQAVSPQRLAARGARQLAPPDRPVGGRASERDGGNPDRVRLRGARRHVARGA